MNTRAQKILTILQKHYPNVKCALVHESAWQLLMSTILSAQCTDKRVNIVTSELYKKYPTVYDIYELDLSKLKDLIRSTGFYNNKAKNIKGAAAVIVEKYNGQVPDTMAQLVELPGVARKTANVVLSVWFHKNEGVTVDTHVQRLARRYGLTKATNVEKIEQDLMRQFEQKDWGLISFLLIEHGRNVATARSPKNDLDVLKGFLVE